MTKPIYFFFTAWLLLLTACAGIKKETGYYRISQTVSADSVVKLKSNLSHAINNDLFESFIFTGNNHITIPYRLLRPVKLGKADKYPLVLVLHSSGAIGTDNVSQLGVLAKLWAKPTTHKQYPAYVVVPQFPQRSSNYYVDRDRNVLASVPAPSLSQALQLIDSLKQVLPINVKQIYVIGFSMGASSTVNSLGLRPDLFAAAVSVSGIPDFNYTDKLAQIPLWLIHGNADTENPIPSDKQLYKELLSRHAQHIKFWEIDHLNHDVYSELYTSDAIPAWLFGHKKK
ncbi:MAG: alpha/beta hydrolase-fold protein [Mucilaginibacter sp.]|uniref:carboxylesterase family protein n=1 Tax=Mucilaginibacter sp. TaxID=1882438 RepID=UPI0031A543A9